MFDLCVCDAENKLYENGILKNNDKVKFIVNKYALIESYKNGYYYYAVNLDTFKKKQVSRRKYPIMEKDYEQLALKIRELDTENNLNTKITRYDRAKNLLRHIFSYILPTEGFSFRKNQLDLSLEILSSLQRNCIALMEAEVGTGKTHAYIIAVIIYNIFNDIKETTVISTSTIALQKAITEEYIPQISDILLKYRIIRKPIDFVIRKGKSHYACDVKLKTYLSSIIKNNAERDKNLIEILHNLSCAVDSQIDLDTYPLTRYVKERINVTNKCSEHCSMYNSCRFINFSKKCLYGGYYFQISNHNYVIADILSYKPLIPKYRIVIFDEAHKLYDAAKQMYGCYLSDSEFSDLIKYTEESKARSLQKCIEEVSNIYPKLFCRLTGFKKKGDYVIGRESVNLDNLCMYYIKSIIDMLTDIIETVYDCDEIRLHIRKQRIKKMCGTIKNKLEVFLRPDNLICWWEYNGKSVTVSSIPKELSKIIYKDFWAGDTVSILTSGTLSAHNDFSLIKSKLGIDTLAPERIAETSKKSPFNYKENALIYIPEYMPFPNLKNIEYVNAVAIEIDRLLRAAYGHSLVLFTSYRLMEMVFHNIDKNKYDYPMFIMGRGRIDALRDFKISGNGVLFASDSAGEGVDIVGDTLSNLIVVKLPFAVPDPISEYEQSIVGGLDSYLKKVNTPNMIIKLKQYVGRLIRSESDTGVVSILDSRVNSQGKYRNIVLESLFDADVTNNIADVERFILDKKDTAYFE